MNNTEKQYEELLKAADKVAGMNDGEELSDEAVDMMIKMLDGGNSDPSQYFPSNMGKTINENTDPSQNVTQKVLVSANPATGVLNTIPYNEEEITEESLDKLLDLEEEDLKKIEINWESFVETVKMMYPNADEAGIRKLLEAVNKYRANIDFPYFNELPDFIKKEIDEYVKAGATQYQASNNTIKQFRNMLAKELFDTLIATNYQTKAFADISKFTVSEINKEKEKLGGMDVGEYNANLRREYEIGFIEKAEELESRAEDGDLEKAEKLRKTSRAFTQSYTYEDMYNAYKTGKIKVKNIQIEKFNRTCQEFNRKYYNSTFQIKDIGMTIGVLDRMLDQKYNLTCIKKFITAFINYTKNFKPSNVDEHVFMFYFIQHILTLDVKIPGNGYQDFNEIVKENIYKFLDLIIEKDTQKEELKKGMKK